MNIQNILADLGIQDRNHGVMIGAETFGLAHPSTATPLWTASALLPLHSIQRRLRARDDGSHRCVCRMAQMDRPQRGEVVRQYGDALRAKKDSLGALVSYEMGKSYQEGLGEVQEMIDICDLPSVRAVNSTASPCTQSAPTSPHVRAIPPTWCGRHHQRVQLPCAVWCWNTALAWISGDVCVWKPSESTPLLVGCQHIWNEVAEANNLPAGVSCIVNGDYKVGEWMTADKRVPLVSATGSIRMGKIVAQAVAARLGRSLLVGWKQRHHHHP